MRYFTMAIVVAFIAAMMFGSSGAMADACDEEVANAASKIGFRIGRRAGPPGFVALHHPRGGETTYICHSKLSADSALVLYAKEGSSLDDFTDFVGKVGAALLRQPSETLKMAAHECIMAARRGKGYVRSPLGRITLDCNGGTGGAGGVNPKVTFEFPPEDAYR